MTLEEGVYETDSVDYILDAMIANAKEYFDRDLNDSEESIIRTFYQPIAIEFRNLQDDIGLVLESSQIENAQGEALDLLTALIGVHRNPSEKATGTVTFSRENASESVDYIIPSGTVVQTEGLEPIRFVTQESKTLEIGETSVDVEVEAVQSGPESNVIANTITQITGSPTGIEQVINSSAIGGGQRRENDDELRERAKKELAEGSRATQSAIIRTIDSVPGTESVKIFPNTTENDLGEKPGFELVVHGGNSDEIAQSINDTKAAGDITYGGNFGEEIVSSATILNGQKQEERFSRPEKVEIYIEASLETTDEYMGDDDVINSIVNYIGGTNTNGNNISGQITVGDDVIHGEIEYAIRSIQGVYDVDSLYVDVYDSPNSSSNIEIEDFEVATVDGLGGNIEIMT